MGPSDIVKYLEMIPLWKRLSEMPARLEALEKRLAAVEALASAPASARCPKCWKGVMCATERRADPMFGAMGVARVARVCDQPGCGWTDEAQVG